MAYRVYDSAGYPTGELVNIGACVEPQVREQLFKLAGENGRSVSAEIRRILGRELAREREHEPVPAA